MNFLTTITPYIVMICGVGLLGGAAWQLNLPASQYGRPYAEIGTRDDTLMFLWAVGGLAAITLGADYAFNGGTFAHALLSELRQ